MSVSPNGDTETRTRSWALPQPLLLPFDQCPFCLSQWLSLSVDWSLDVLSRTLQTTLSLRDLPSSSKPCALPLSVPSALMLPLGSFYRLFYYKLSNLSVAQTGTMLVGVWIYCPWHSTATHRQHIIKYWLNKFFKCLPWTITVLFSSAKFQAGTIYKWCRCLL